MSATPIDVTDGSASCAVDRSCPPESGCCGAPEPSAATEAKSWRGAKAAVLAVLCVAGCLAVPLAVGGAAALGGALAGEWWLAVAALVAAGAAAVAIARRRGRSGC